MKQNKTKQNKTKQNKTKQNKTKQNKTKQISLLALVLLFIFGMNNTNAQTITSPENGKIYNAGIKLDFSWEKYNNNTDRYSWKREYKFTNIKTGEIITSKPDDSGTEEESWWYGKLNRQISSVDIPCGFAGTAALTVTAEKRIFLTRRRKRFSPQSTPQASAATVIDIAVVEPNLPQVYVNCEVSNEFLISITPTNNNYSIRWYIDLTSTSPLFNGNIYKRMYPPGLTTLFITQVYKLNNCEFESPRTPVSVYTFVPPAPIPLKIDRELFPDDDPRTPGYARCSDPLSYQDFDKISVLADIPSIDLTTQYTYVSVDYVPSWTNSSDFEGNTQRVCYDKLNDAPGGCRTYELKSTAKVVIKAINPSTGEVIPSIYDNEDCIKLVTAKVTLCQKKKCEPIWAKAALIYPSTLDNCTPDLVNPTLLCSSSNKVIGPNEATFNNTDWIPDPTSDKFTKVEYTFDWTVANTKDTRGLSATNIKNPNVSYITVPIQEDQFFKYYLKIQQKTKICTLFDQTTNSCLDNNTKENIENLYFCYLVYKCRRCVSGQRIMAVENEEDVLDNNNEAIIEKVNENKLDIFPNPATDILNISYTSTNYDNVEGNIIGLDGKLLQTFNVSDNNTIQLNLDNLPAGIYNISINNNGNISSKKLIIFE